MSTRSILVHILDAKIQKQRLKDMKNAAMKRNISVADVFCSDVTHIVTEFKEYDAVLRRLGITDEGGLDDVEIVCEQWFTESMRAGKLVEVEQKHRLQRSRNVTGTDADVGGAALHPVMGEYGCQRVTPFRHLNEKYTKALEVLEKFAEFREGDHDYSRALAFRRASCVLKSLLFALSNIQQLHNITNIGDHSKRVVQEILEDGESLEVENILKDPWFHKMKLFTEIFGIGPSTAKQFIAKGWSSIEEVQIGYKSADWRVQWGLAFHKDLTTPVLRQEACYVYRDLVEKHLSKVLPGAIAVVTGGFRRGKTSGHDVDILITHPKETKIVGVLAKLLHSLESTDTVLSGRLERSTYSDDILSRNTKLSARGQLDHFEKWIGIIKVPKKIRESSVESDTDLFDSGVPHSNNGAENFSENSKTENTFQQNESNDKSVQDLNNQSGTQVIFSRTGPKNKNEAKDVVLQESNHAEDDRNQMDTFHVGRTPDENKQQVDTFSGGSVDVSELKAGHVKRADSRCSENLFEFEAEDRDWLARRVDLIIAPYSQYYYALVGWTGSKQFNRDARTYAERKLNMKLSSHGLYDLTLGKKIPASSEKEVFDNLKLPHHNPWQRNC